MNNEFICKECNASFTSLEGVNRHVKVHELSCEKYHLKWKYNNVVPKCACGCGQEVLFTKRVFNRFIHSHQCNDPVIRQKMIDEGRRAAADPEKIKVTSRKVAAKWQEPEYRAKMLEHLKHVHEHGDKSYHSDPAYRKAISDAKKEFWKSPEGAKTREYMKSADFHNVVSKGTRIGMASEEVRREISLRASKNQMLGIIGPNLTKRSWKVNPFTNEIEHYDSGWEELLVEEAFKRNKPIIRNKSVIVPYVSSDGKSKNSVPDFISVSGKTLIEVKGMMTQNDVLKIKAYDKFCQKHGMMFVLFENKLLMKFDERLWDLVI